jgi:aminopeptidase N
MPSRGLSFLWPSFCGNLFPCQSDPALGQRYTLDVVGVPDGLTVVAPSEITAAAPAYMPGVAVGSFERRELGRTSAGTLVSAWYPPALAADAARGTANLVAVFEFLERTYGPYTFGDEVGSVAADWRPNATGGMEHHPYWHVGFADFDNEEVHAHEAAHGWFGNGVRIGCWEDFVLSEGTVSYLSARALEAQGVDVWPEFGCLLRYDCFAPGGANAEVLPDQTCGEIDLLTHPIWSTATYMKGAFFYREVAEGIGVDVVDEVIATFYREHVGGSARMSELIRALRSAAGPAAARVDEAERRWLRTEVCPEEVRTFCSQP